MARHRGPRFGFVLGGFALVAVAAITAALLYKDPHPAPMNAGVCWRMTFEGGRLNFHPIVSNVANLETCAAVLERIHIQQTGDVYGAYQGRYLFVSDDAISAAPTLSDSRWKVFYGQQRRALDLKLEGLRVVPTVTTMPAR